VVMSDLRDGEGGSRVFSGAAALGAAPHTTLVVIGNFDGVHAGHRSVLGSSAAEAQRRGLSPIVLTFDPHPSSVLGRGSLPVLTTLSRKVELLLRVDPSLSVVVEPFTLELAALSPRDFAAEFLAGELGAELVVVGRNFRFGHQREGDLDTLLALGGELGFEARAEPLFGDAEGPYSSTRVRAALAAGDLVTVRALLGRPHSLSGTVVTGAARGRTIGFPTANLAPVPEALPPYGVYAGFSELRDAAGARQLVPSVANIGERPTLDAGFSVEVHLFDFDADLYGRTLRFHLVERLRPERRFENFEALRAQIVRDAEDARRVLAARGAEQAEL
jgi:riboflavin kinase/FMN adenylyltransferase